MRDLGMALRYPLDARAARAELDAVLARLQRHVPDLITFALILVLAMQLAYWTWVFATPKAPLPPRAAQPAGSADTLARARANALFGDAPNVRQAAAPSAAARGDIVVTGVFAALGTLPAFAILSIDGQPGQPVKAGDAIRPGLILESVAADHVIVRRNGVRERVELAPRGGTAPVGVVAAPGVAVNIEAVGAREYRLSRSQFAAALQDPKALGNMGRAGAYPSGGVALEEVPPGSLPERLGFRVGDVVRQVNGQFIANPQEMPRIYQQLASGSVNEVRIEVIRAGQPQQFIYHIQP